MIESMKTATRICLFIITAILMYGFIRAFGSTFSIVANKDNMTFFGAASLILTVVIAQLTQIAYLVIGWGIAEVAFDIHSKLGKIKVGQEISQGASKTTWESWKKVGR